MPQYMRTISAQQPRGGPMICTFISQHKIYRIRRIKLVDFEPPVENRHVPFQKIDKHPFSGLKHGTKSRVQFVGDGSGRTEQHRGHLSC